MKENVISTKDLIRLGFRGNGNGLYSIGNDSGNILSLIKDDDFNWRVLFDNNLLLITWYNEETLTHLLKGLRMNGY